VAAVSLDDKYTLERGRAYMTGIDALVRLPMLQHRRDQAHGLNTACFISGYRGSPLGGLDQALWNAGDLLKRHNIHFLPGINEDLGMTAVWGSQQVNLFPGANYDGVFGLWYGKGPGLDRSMDVLKHANAFGTSKYGGVLAVVGDDHACKSSTLPHQSDHMFIGATSPVLNPAGVQEVLDLGVYGWELSRYCGCWVGLKAITENMDAAISAEIDPDRVHIVLPEDFELPAGGVHARWPDAPLEQEERLQRHKIYAALAFARANKLNRVVMNSPNARLGIVTTGKSYLDTLQALADLGIDEQLAAQIGIRVFKVGMSWPLEPVSTHEFADGLEEILVVEEKRSVIEDQLTGQLYNWPVERRPRVVGEYDEHRNLLVTNLAELTPAMIARVIAARIARFYDSKQVRERLAFLEAKEAALAKPRNRAERQPWYCSGCPHNTSTVVPEGSVAYGGIGCHYMATWMDRDTITFAQMGGEGATWLGQAPFTQRKHVFQNLGDGTYFHSGLLAIRAAVAAGVNITYKILYNDAVAMTGGQHVDGPLSVEQLVYQLRGEGVRRIAVVSDEPEGYEQNLPQFSGLSVDHRDGLDAVQRELRDTEGCTVLIYAQTCAAEKRRRRRRGLLEDPAKRVFINSDVCEGCGDCGAKSNCLSVVPKETPLGRKRDIDQSACNKDYSCVKGFCPSFVTVHGGELRKSASAGREVDAATDSWVLAEPALPGIDEPYNLLVAGVGGTGVLTISSVLGMAAHIEGHGASVLNQTGLAQKFGAVTGHVRIAQRQADIFGPRIPAGSANVLLGADLVVSAGDEALAKLDNRFSSAVVNSHRSPTAEFTQNPDAPFHKRAMEQTLREETGAERASFLDATHLATQLMGDAIFANFLLLGCAYQQGLVPLRADSISQAITLNGVAVEQNLQAFAWGRRYIADPERVLNLAGISVTGDTPSHPPSLQQMIDYRAGYLADYQNASYATTYRTLVSQAADAERALTDGNEDLARAVAEGYFKLLAYKDEYEVARLYARKEFTQALQEQFEGPFKLRFHLAPPLLARRDPHSGELQKREFGGWLLPLFRALAPLKRLRGTAFDPFGYTEERRMERQLLREYESTMQHVISHLSEENLPLAIELAALPLSIRGFGHVKQTNATIAAERRQTLLDRFDGRGDPEPGEQIVKLVEPATMGKR
jgi:indolepyruvate ferredoxin oxidoreductase